MKQYDLVIVGNSILSYSITYSLLRQDKSMKIAIIGRSGRVGSATVAAGAMLNCFAEVTSLTLKNETSRSLFEMSVKALRLWQNWLDEIVDESKSKDLKINNGTFVIHNANSGELDTKHYNAILDALDSYGEPYERVSPKSIRGYNPVDDCRSLEAIYLPNEGSLCPETILKAFEVIFSNYETVDIINSEVLCVKHKGNYFETQTESEAIQSEQLLIAAGAYSQKFIDQFPDIADSIPKIVAGVGYSVIMEQDPANRAEKVIRTPNRAGACGLHALPSSNEKNLYIGATNNVMIKPEEHTKAALSYFLLKCAMEQVNQNLHNSRIINWKVGNRPVPIDGYPLLGQTSIPGLWIATGTYRDGFHKSPLIGHHMANLILGKSSIVEHELFIPERKFIRGITKSEAIDEAVEHFISGSYEWSMALPIIGYNAMLKEYITERFHRIYDELDIDFGLNPDLMIMLHFAKENKETGEFCKAAIKAIA